MKSKAKREWSNEEIEQELKKTDDLILELKRIYGIK